MFPDGGKAMIARIKDEHPGETFTREGMFALLRREYPGMNSGHYEYFWQQWDAWGNEVKEISA